MPSPTCQPPVPALASSTRPVSPASSTRCCITISAVGERQMLPMQTKTIRYGAPTAPSCQAPGACPALRMHAFATMPDNGGMNRHGRPDPALAAALLGTLALLVAGCSSGAGGGSAAPGGEGAAAVAAEPLRLTAVSVKQHLHPRQSI